MSFRKRKKKSKNNTHFKVSHINTTTTDEDTTIDTLTNQSASISLSFQTKSNSARIQSTDLNNKKKRKRRKMRIKASQRSYQSNSNSTTNTINPNTNTPIYNDEYLNSLKLENKSMNIPKHIKQSIQNNQNTINISDTEIEMKNTNNDTDNSDDFPMDNDIIQAKILTSKLQRRTKALSNAIDTYAQNSNANTNRKIYTATAKITDPMEQFIALGKFKTTRDEIQQRLNENENISIDLTNDNDDFEMQQMAKSGIKNAFKKTKKRDVIIIDDDSIENTYKNSTEWNEWNDNYNALELDDVLTMINNDINGKQNIVKPMSNLENVEQEYNNICNELQNNIEQCAELEEKYEFFERLRNESIAYLNCLSEKQIVINKYKKMDLFLREQRCHLLRMNYCLNEFEMYNNAFYCNEFIKDINSAIAYEKLNDLNDLNNNNNNESIFDFGMDELQIWDEKKLKLNPKNYLLSKKKRMDFRNKSENKCMNYFENINIENQYFIAREKLLNEMQTVFEDTRIKYRSFNTMCAVLEEWKQTYLNEYKQAFVSVSIPKLIAPFVRLELIEWNVLKCAVNIDLDSDIEIGMNGILNKPKLFVKCKWYELIVNYGIKNGTMNENDDDDLIVPTLVASLVIGELINVIKFDWNIYNKYETNLLLLNVKCALEHIDEYQQFNARRQVVLDALYGKCDECINDLVELKCVRDMIQKIMPGFKQLARKPVDSLDNNGNEVGSNLPGGLMYEYVKRRVFNGLVLLECMSIMIVGSCGESGMEYLIKMTEYVYKMVIEGFMTYLGRCPIRQAKNDNGKQIVVLDDLCNIVKRLFEVKNLWKLKMEDDDDDDVGMDVEDKVFELSEYVMKHVRRSVMEINNNINDMIKSNANVMRNLSWLNQMCSC